MDDKYIDVGNNDLIHVGMYSVFIGLKQKGVLFCPGCKSGLTKEDKFKIVPVECPFCNACLWYYYGGQMKKRSIDELREVSLNKDNLSDVNLAAFFIQLYEKNIGDIIPNSEDAIYPAFGDYWDCKVVRSIQTIRDTSFAGNDNDTVEYIRFFVGKCKSGELKWNLISSVELSDQYAYNKKTT